MFWVYKTASKRLIGQTPFRLVYGKEAVMPMKFIVPNLRVVVMTNLIEENEAQKNWKT